MKSYRVNDIFYSLQGEGHNTGRAAAFVRFAGCNLRCAFCDTSFDSFTEMSGEDIVAAIDGYGCRFVVLTGGEPTLQVDEDFVDLLHSHGFEVAMESNGTRPAPRNLDWLTVSPKSLPPTSSGQSGGCAPLFAGWQQQVNELKIVFTDEVSLLQITSAIGLPLQPKEDGEIFFYLQPCDTGDAHRNALITSACVTYIKQHPHWRLSLQTHKLIGIE